MIEPLKARLITKLDLTILLLSLLCIDIDLHSTHISYIVHDLNALGVA